MTAPCPCAPPSLSPQNQRPPSPPPPLAHPLPPISLPLIAPSSVPPVFILCPGSYPILTAFVVGPLLFGSTSQALTPVSVPPPSLRSVFASLCSTHRRTASAGLLPPQLSLPLVTPPLLSLSLRPMCRPVPPAAHPDLRLARAVIQRGDRPPGGPAPAGCSATMRGPGPPAAPLAPPLDPFVSLCPSLHVSRPDPAPPT